MCGSPDSLQNTTVSGKNFTVGNEISYTCLKGHALVGDSKRTCGPEGTWSGRAPTCKCKFYDQYYYVNCLNNWSNKFSTIWSKLMFVIKVI